MKGYNEERGLSCKLEFDADTKTFVSRPIVHDFRPTVRNTFVRQKIAEWREHRNMQKACCLLNSQILAMNTHLHEDIWVNALAHTGEAPTIDQPTAFGPVPLAQS